MSFSAIYRTKFKTWTQLEAVIEALPTTKEKGDAFEDFCYAFFKYRSALYRVGEIYKSQDIPESLKEKYHLAHRDSGVDGLIITTEGKAIAYQSKFRTSRKKPSYEELTKFWSEGRYCDYLCTVANCYEVTDLSDKHLQNLKVLVDEFDNLDENFFEYLYDLTNAVTIKERKLFSPHDYQEKIINDVLEGFKIEDRGKVIAACGTGKTLTSLWIVEKMESCDCVLFLAPSITLVKQTLENWADQHRKPFSFICVCSDNTVGDSVEDIVDINPSDIGVPVTTDETVIADFLSKGHGRKYVFATYQSADKIANAIEISKTCFDLIICDEAHRTAGAAGMFSLALDAKIIPAKKRLFMTATERLIRPNLMKRAEQNGLALFSMDDEKVYGPVLSKYNFGDAIKDKTISDYKIVISGIKESEILSSIRENADLVVDDEAMNAEDMRITAQSLFAKVLLAKAMDTYSLKKVISFHSSIQRAKDFVSDNTNDVPLGELINKFNNIEDSEMYVGHISSQNSAADRGKIMRDFKEADYSVLSNAKCLTEGVDVPIIDSVFFVDRRTSLVDIVQACGRALRTKKGTSKTAYFLVPIIIPDGDSQTEMFNSDQFEIVYNIIQSLRDQDTRLASWIDELNKKYVKGQPRNVDNESPIVVDITNISLQDFADGLYTQIATVNNYPEIIRVDIDYTRPGARKAGQKRMLKTIGDYSIDAFKNNLINPTIKFFKDKGVSTLPKTEIVFGHNNVSHTVRIGLITDAGSGCYKLTALGQAYVNEEISLDDILRMQMLKYSCILERGRTDMMFPYRMCLKLFAEYNLESLSFLEYAFCIYPIQGSTPKDVKQAADDIAHLNSSYPNLIGINMANRAEILKELNDAFKSTISEQDIWGTKSTTVRNQFGYLRGHLAHFDELFVVNGQALKLKEGGKERIKALLDLDLGIENMSESEYLRYYSSPRD